MKNIEILFIPILMFADYYLTFLGDFYRKKKFAEFYIIDTYELNPLWKKDIEQFKWFNYKHILIVTGITIYFYYLSISDGKSFYEFSLAFYFTTYGIVNGRHLNNILLFKYIYNNTNEISGKIHISHLSVLKMSQYQTIVFIVPLLLLTILHPNIYLYGALTASIMLYFTMFFWIRKHKKKCRNR